MVGALLSRGSPTPVTRPPATFRSQLVALSARDNGRIITAETPAVIRSTPRRHNAIKGGKHANAPASPRLFAPRRSQDRSRRQRGSERRSVLSRDTGKGSQHAQNPAVEPFRPRLR